MTPDALLAGLILGAVTTLTAFLCDVWRLGAAWRVFRSHPDMLRAPGTIRHLWAAISQHPHVVALHVNTPADVDHWSLTLVTRDAITRTWTGRPLIAVLGQAVDWLERSADLLPPPPVS